jgi:hypothetical protein
LNQRTTEISDLLLTTSEILKQITQELATTGETPYPPEEELECVKQCASNLMSVKLLQNFNAIWLTEEEQESLDMAVTMSDAITRLLNQELDDEID